jgi:hypothetical protein
MALDWTMEAMRRIAPVFLTWNWLCQPLSKESGVRTPLKTHSVNCCIATLMRRAKMHYSCQKGAPSRAYEIVAN